MLFLEAKNSSSEGNIQSCSVWMSNKWSDDKKIVVVSKNSSSVSAKE